MNNIYTLGSLLEELKVQPPKFETGQFFEVIKSIYPGEEVSSDNKNFIIEGIKLTIPLAISSKSKKQFKKDNSPFFQFSKDNTRGDFLEIIETDGLTAKCINRSLKEDIQNKYYISDNVQYITISFNEVLDSTVRRVYRGIKKYII